MSGVGGSGVLLSVLVLVLVSVGVDVVFSECWCRCCVGVGVGNGVAGVRQNIRVTALAPAWGLLHDKR